MAKNTDPIIYEDEANLREAASIRKVCPCKIYDNTAKFSFFSGPVLSGPVGNILRVPLKEE